MKSPFQRTEREREEVFEWRKSETTVFEKERRKVFSRERRTLTVTAASGRIKYFACFVAFTSFVSWQLSNVQTVKGSLVVGVLFTSLHRNICQNE